MPEEDLFENGWINTHPNRIKWIRVDPESGGLYSYNSVTGLYNIPLPLPLESINGLEDALADKSNVSHEHPNHGNINFTGTVSADGTQGITGEKTLGGYKITFKKGLLVGFQQV